MIDIRDPQLYLDWSETELSEHIKMLRDLQSKKLGITPLPTKDRLSKMFDPESDNFMGMGMSMFEFLAAGKVREIQDNIMSQDREERNRRMALIIEMSAELKMILGKTRFATRMAEGAIEDVIKGDWNGLRIMADHFAFEDEHESTRQQYAPIYERFAQLCQEAFDKRPGAEELVPPPKN